MGWILTVLMTVIALIAIMTIWRRHQREVHRLRSAHQQTIQRIDHDHDQRIARIGREYDRNLRHAHHPLAIDLLPAMDSLDEALTHFDDLDLDASAPIEDLCQGIDLARQGLLDALLRHGVVPISPSPGARFDPTIHEAIGRHEDPEQVPGTVHRLLRRGYRDESHVLRSALVVVNVAVVSAPSTDENVDQCIETRPESALDSIHDPDDNTEDREPGTDSDTEGDEDDDATTESFRSMTEVPLCTAT